MLKIPFGTEQASESMVRFLLSIGALFTDENGIHASETGIYNFVSEEDAYEYAMERVYQDGDL